MKKTPPPPLEVVELVRVLDKTTRVMQTISMRLDVLAFGQCQCEQRIYRLEKRLAKLLNTAHQKGRR